MAYEWIKALHIISVIAWMAGLLYLPRLYVYHAMVEAGSVRAETFKLMERRLLKVIMNPAMIASWGFGLAMLYMNSGLFLQIWMMIKFACVIVMTVAHIVFGRMRKELEDDNARSGGIYRMWNEVPTLLMIIIVIMAVVEPI